MNGYKFLNTVFRTITAFILIGASVTVPLSAGATESFYLSADVHAAAMEAADRFKVEFKPDLTETIRPLTAPQFNSVVATGPMDDVTQEDQPMSSHAASASRANDS